MDDRADEEFSRYVTRRSAALLRTAAALTRQPADAEDLLQTALAKTYLSWDRVRDREAVDGYVRRIMVNTHVSDWRRQRRHDEVPTDVLPERGALGPLAQVGERAALWAAVKRLPPRQRAVVVLRYYEDLTEAETARLLDVSVGTVKSTTHAALAALRASAELAPSAGGASASCEHARGPARRSASRPVPARSARTAALAAAGLAASA